MFVVHFAETIRGGIASYLRDLLPLQVKRYGPGAVALVVPHDQIDDLGAVLGGVLVVTFDGSAGRLTKAWRVALIARRMFLRFPDAIFHCHSTYAGASVRLMVGPSFNHKKVVYCAHGWAWDQQLPKYLLWFFGLAERLFARWSKFIVCISEHDFNSAARKGIDPSKLKLVRNGIDLSMFPAITKRLRVEGRLPVALFLGRFDRQKGADIFCEVMQSLVGQAEGLIAGGSVLSGDLGMELPPNVRSLGWISRSTLAEVFSTVDVLVMPSRWEGFGLVAIEAMASGIPVIASDVGGLSELVFDGVNGYRVPAEDPSAISALLRLFDYEKFEAMGRSAREIVLEKYSILRVESQLDEIYRGCA